MSTKGIVHLATDEKFINVAYDIYEQAFPGKNRFIILHNGGRIKYLAQDRGYDFVNIDANNKWIDNVISKIREVNYVVFHGLNLHQAEIALAIDTKAKLIWTVFGAEVYQNTLFFTREIYGKQTFRNYLGLSYSFKNKFRPLFYQLLKKNESGEAIVVKAMRRMHICSILYAEELEFFKEKRIVNNDIQWMKFTYYPLDLVINSCAEFVSEGNILLGNSASSTNNHLEAFRILQQKNITGRNIICPLSYGNMQYSADIKKKGERFFKKQFVALTKFVSLTEYQALTQTCGIVIMNHYRQQAVGNVLDMMYRGAKVFLTKKNTLYHYLKRIGCAVYSIEDDLMMSDALMLLDRSAMQANRKILSEEISLDNIIKQLRQSIEI